MVLDVSEQDVNNILVALLQMSKTPAVNAEAMKVLLMLHDKIEKQLPKEKPAVKPMVGGGEKVDTPAAIKKTKGRKPAAKKSS